MLIFKLFLTFADSILPFIELLEIVDLHFNVGFVDCYNFLVEIFNFCLKILDLLIHPFDVLFSLPKVLPPLVLLLFEVLF